MSRRRSPARPAQPERVGRGASPAPAARVRPERARRAASRRRPRRSCRRRAGRHRPSPAPPRGRRGRRGAGRGRGRRHVRLLRGVDREAGRDAAGGRPGVGIGARLLLRAGAPEALLVDLQRAEHEVVPDLGRVRASGDGLAAVLRQHRLQAGRIADPDGDRQLVGRADEPGVAVVLRRPGLAPCGDVAELRDLGRADLDHRLEDVRGLLRDPARQDALRDAPVAAAQAVAIVAQRHPPDADRPALACAERPRDEQPAGRERLIRVREVHRRHAVLQAAERHRVVARDRRADAHALGRARDPLRPDLDPDLRVHGVVRERRRTREGADARVVVVVVVDGELLDAARDVEHLALGGPRRRRRHAAAQRRGEHEGLERRAGLALALRGEVERCLVVVGAADHRADLAGLVVDRDERRLRARGVAEPPRDRDLGVALQGEVERRLDAQPAQQRLTRAVAIDDLLAHPAREVRDRLAGGLRRRRADRRARRHRLLAPARVLAARHVALLEHLLQDDVAPALGGEVVGDRVKGRRRGDEPGQQCGLVRLELGGAAALGLAAAAVVDVVAEVRAGRGFDPVRAVAEVDRVEVLGEDLLLGPLARQVVGQRGLAHLLEHGPAILRARGVLDELLRDRRSALDGAALGDVLPERPPRAAQVDALVLVEALVLDRDDRVLHRGRDRRGGNDDPALIGERREVVPVDVGEQRVLRLLELGAVLELRQV